MAERDIIRIDESRCDGCGDCVPVCAEGAIQIVGNGLQTADYRKQGHSPGPGRRRK